MFNDFKNSLDSARECGERVYKNTECIATIRHNVNKELTTYADIIPEFFSYDKEALKLKALYKKLKELDYVRNRVISCIDVERAGNLYMEYFTGMCSFINKYIDEAKSENTENLPLMEKQLQTAIQADPLFIDSLFGGKNNERVEKELTDAIQNVEYLVDFIKVLMNIRENVNLILTNAESLSGKYGTSRTTGIKYSSAIS